ncbi:hypothetical protein NY547_17630 [Cnuibacter physcomitrellae]|uniref:hypothetical protein n=1 Tax=Cnuibacter physcomitrellae TaxID=1619308 RepID=UPI00217595BB|nr:hypothetical protein [Cnuibacter physcomitrellae]MCS5499072.1 hypothetical protein [Cnuibacter physcomitrellae]
MEKRVEERGVFWDRRWVGTTGFVLALLVGFAVPVVVIVLTMAAAPYMGDAIDSYDDNILAASERAALTGIAQATGVVLLVGTVMGLIALTIGAATTRTNKRAGTTILLAVIAPLVCLFFAFWTLSAAGSPDVIEGAPDLRTPTVSLTSSAL